MIFHPTILALLAGSTLISFLILYSASYAIQILRRWDLQSGSERQLVLERKTYLVSTLLAYVFGFELLSFFLFIFVADQIHSFFTGAMCAAGSLYVNAYGYPTLIVKLVNFLLAGIWLVLNYVDNKGYDYPLIRKKYRFFLLLVPLVLLEMVLQANFFWRLDPEIITSCCGTLFSSGANALPVAMMPFWRGATIVVFYATVLSTVICGGFFFIKGRGAYLFAGLSALAFVTSFLSVFSFISLYIYEMPTHHCPFCMLQGEYGYIGYPLYLLLLGGTITGIGTGVLRPFKGIASLSGVLPSIQRRLAVISSVCFLIFAGIVTVRILLSNLILSGY